MLFSFFYPWFYSGNISASAMFVMDKVAAIIALALAKKASAYAVVRVSGVTSGYIRMKHVLRQVSLCLFCV